MRIVRVEVNEVWPVYSFESWSDDKAMDETAVAVISTTWNRWVAIQADYDEMQAELAEYYRRHHE